MGNLFGISRVAQINLTCILICEQDWRDRAQEDMKVYERNCYDCETLIYEGEGYRLNDRFYRHGQGKAYRLDGSLEYQGEFTHDEACGRGVCYWENGNVMYEGKLWHGKWFGWGRSYRESGVLCIEGTFVDGIANGKARFYKGNGMLYYEGMFQNGKANGKGRSYNENTGNLYYEGEYADNEVHGMGRLYHDNGMLKYEGRFKHSKYDSYGREYSEDGTLLYEGPFLHGKRVLDTENEKKWESEILNKIPKEVPEDCVKRTKEDDLFADWDEPDTDDILADLLAEDEDEDENFEFLSSRKNKAISDSE